MFKFLAIGLLAACTALAQAQPASEQLTRCLADNTTGKDRKDLARWVFLAMSAHPEIRAYASDDAVAGRIEANVVAADTFTRLLAETCAQQTRAALKDGGSVAIQTAFQTLGQLAMQEIMSNREVAEGMRAFEKHLDQDKLKKALSED